MKKIALTLLTLPLLACGANEADTDPGLAEVDGAFTTSCAAVSDDPVKIEGGTFIMGSDAVYREEGPERQTTVSSFWIDRHEVTNRQFDEFVQATGYVSVAEQPVNPEQFGVPAAQIPADLLKPGSAVFRLPEGQPSNAGEWWVYVPGASWKKPYGPDGPDAVANEPVVHLAWDDMNAYADWKRGRLPTEAEWEFAASAGAEKYTEQPDPQKANSWQGVFPVVNEGTDGFKDIAPVGCFEPNAFGLYDMVGNVWEVTADYFRPGHDPNQTDDPRGPSESDALDPFNPQFPSRVMKGGSFLCAPNYCQRYRPESRQGRDPGLGASNVGFRLAYDNAPSR